MARDAYYPFYIGEWSEETSRLSLAAAGAFAHFRSQSWNSATRGVLCYSLDGYCRLFGATREQTIKVIEELTHPTHPLLERAERDGEIELTYRRFVELALLRDTRAEAGRKGGKVKAGKICSKHPSKPLVMDMDVGCTVISATKGGVGGNGESADPSPSLDPNVPLDDRVRQWLNGMRRFPFINTSPKHVSDVVKMVEKWGFEFVGQCLDAAFDSNARSPVPYAMSVAERRAGREFADKPKPVKSSGKGTTTTYRPG